MADGEKYKFEILTSIRRTAEKVDPFGFAFGAPPQAAAVEYELSRYLWKDDDWMAWRHDHGGWLHQPMAIYEVHLGSWARVREESNRFLTYHEMADRLVPYVKDLGFTHIELLPVMEHPFSGSWGTRCSGSSRRQAG